MLHINEQMLNISLNPSNMPCVSFSTRDGEMEKLGNHNKQQHYLQLIEETDPQDYKEQEILLQEAGIESEVEKEDDGDEEQKPCTMAIMQPSLKPIIPVKNVKFMLNVSL